MFSLCGAPCDCRCPSSTCLHVCSAGQRSSWSLSPNHGGRARYLMMVSRGVHHRQSDNLTGLRTHRSDSVQASPGCFDHWETHLTIKTRAQERIEDLQNSAGWWKKQRTRCSALPCSTHGTDPPLGFMDDKDQMAKGGHQPGIRQTAVDLPLEDSVPLAKVMLSS